MNISAAAAVLPLLWLEIAPVPEKNVSGKHLIDNGILKYQGKSRFLRCKSPLLLPL
ncbi:MAG: hypothetical protein ABSD74_08615 [Rhizomicrobium sp.]